MKQKKERSRERGIKRDKKEQGEERPIKNSEIEEVAQTERVITRGK